MKKLLGGVALLVAFSTAKADDWPHWMGPQRDNVWREKGVIDNFPEGGLKVKWRAPVAGGYAGVAVKGDRLFVTDLVTEANVKVANFGRKKYEGTERVLCLNAMTGKEIWKHTYPVTYNISYPAGPRCTPTVDGDRVYTLGAVGHLFCLDVKSGKPLWSKDLVKEYQTKPALWGYASHPLVYGNSLLCIVGGKGSEVVSFDKKTGKENWRAITASEQGYSPLTIIKAAGVEQLIVLCPDGVHSLNPNNGKLYWSAPYGATNGSIIMTPILWKDYLFVGGYSNKNLLLKLGTEKPSADVVWRDKKGHGLAPINVQPFLLGKVIYGLDQNGKMYAVELPDGKRLWETSAPVSKRPVGSGTAFLVRHQDRFWMFNENGELLIGTLSPKGFKEIDRTKIIDQTNNAFGRQVVWCPPAFAHKCVFVRNDKECICVSLEK